MKEKGQINQGHFSREVGVRRVISSPEFWEEDGIPAPPSVGFSHRAKEKNKQTEKMPRGVLLLC